jgi:hypothetical protein
VAEKVAQERLLQQKLVYCPLNNLTFVIPSEGKESFCEIAASLKLLAMAMYRSVRDMTLVGIC